MNRQYHCVFILVFFTISLHFSLFVEAHNYDEANSTKTTSINEIPYSRINYTDSSFDSPSFVHRESFDSKNSSESGHNLTDNNELDNRLVTNGLGKMGKVQLVFQENGSSTEMSNVSSNEIFPTAESESESQGNFSSLPLPTEQSESLNGTEQDLGDDDEEEEEIDLVSMQKRVKEMALKGLLEIFGLTSPQTGKVGTGPPPDFMVDLYNTVTDSYGVTRAKNPYDAHIVRSLAEKDNSLNDFFYFNIPNNLEGMGETVLEVELHIHRLPTPHDQLHPSLYLTPFYILSLYQVLDPKNLAIPDLHKLLGVHYVPALGSGWEVFNVKQSVLHWMGSQMTNNGFLVAATSLGGDRVPVRFSRRGETPSSKQSILVLFTHDSHMMKIESTSSSSSVQKYKSTLHNSVKVDNNGSSRGNVSEEEVVVNIPTSSLENPRFHHALLYKDSIRHPNSVNRFRSRRSKNQTEGHNNNSSSDSGLTTTINRHYHYRRNLTACSRHDLFVNFEAVGWSSSVVIAPKGYNAFSCDGPCTFPMDQQVKPSNHAIVQSIVDQMNLSPGVGQPCCVPTTLLPISLLFYEDEDTVVLKQYPQMVADSCGCS